MLGGVNDGPENAREVAELLRGMRCKVNLIALNIQTILSTLADNIYSNWIPLFLSEVHDLEFAEMGIYSSLPLLGGAIAAAAGPLRWGC